MKIFKKWYFWLILILGICATIINDVPSKIFFIGSLIGNFIIALLLSLLINWIFRKKE